MDRLLLLVFWPSLSLAGVEEIVTEPPPALETSTFDLFSGAQVLSLGVDSLHSSDIEVSKTGFTYSQEQTDWTLETSLGYTDYSINYTDPVGATQAADLDEDTWDGSITLGRKISDTLEFNIGGSYYEGFSNFQSIWISEYYDQFIGIPFASTYEDADPHGWGLNGGAVWDHKPGVSRITFNLAYGNDQIVPAWSAVPNPDNFFIPEGVRTRNELHTYSGSVAWEYTLSPALRTQLTGRLSKITDRDVRVQLSNDWIWAITPSLTLRGQVGAAQEEPDFDALYGGLSLDYEFTPQWHLGLGARLYTDSGEVVSAGFNTAAPGLDANELSASLAWEGIFTTVRLSAGIYETRYESLSPSNRFFADLYEDRDYTVARFAITRRF